MSVILRSAEGRFYELEEKDLKGKEVKPEDLPADAVSNKSRGPARPTPGGAPGGGSAVQIVIYANNGQPPQVMQGGSQGEGDDVQGRMCGVWSNCGWSNCGHHHW